MPVRTAFDLVRLQWDIAWGAGEFVASMFSEAILDSVTPEADGARPVMTLPGFTGPELSMNPLNRFLNRHGFVAASWGLGTNRGPQSTEHIEELSEVLGARLRIWADRFERPVSLVGQSLGGVYARELARRFPESVDRVITLGSPAHINPDLPDQINKAVDQVARRFTGKSAAQHMKENHHRNIDIPPEVPLVAIYSRYDGVVTHDTTSIPKKYLHKKKFPPRENIEIVCSHCGMGVNPLVLIAIADRLMADPGDWKPFNPSKYIAKPFRALAPMVYPDTRGFAFAV